MKSLNSPLLFLAILVGFIVLAAHAHGTAPVSLDQQPAYSQRDLSDATAFVAFQIRQYPVAVYHPKTKREAALLAADIWGIEVSQ
jgi:hypothetical protein